MTQWIDNIRGSEKLPLIKGNDIVLISTSLRFTIYSSPYGCDCFAHLRPYTPQSAHYR